MLQITLLIMGGSTLLIGLLPSYATIGVAAPILLVLLRLVQGFSAGGEWGGAALMSVEHAPPERRGYFGSFTQLGTPVGILLANGVVLLVTASLGTERFHAWGWRIPFLLSLVMVGIGAHIRARVEESPAFTDLAQTERPARAPVRELLRDHWDRVLLALLTFVGCNAVGYIFLACTLSYGTAQLGMSMTTMLVVVIIGCAFWVATTVLGGHPSAATAGCVSTLRAMPS